MAAESPISALARLLAAQPALKDNRIPVYAWRKGQARSTNARRIVLYPHKIGGVDGGSIPDALVDVKQVMVADCWGADGEEAWAIMVSLVQALQSQSEGKEGEPGYWWGWLGADWDIEADTSTQGETVSVLFEVRFSIPSVPYDLAKLGNWPTGQIDSVSQDNPEYRENR